MRQATEFAHGHVPTAVNVELGEIGGMGASDGPITVMCGHGERAMTAASLLRAVGHEGVTVFDGGPDTWTASTGLRLEGES